MLLEFQAMPDGRVTIVVDGVDIRAEAGSMLASAMLAAGVTAFRKSVSGEPRAPLCGMGVCQECRVRVNGMAHTRACMVPCEQGMEVTTGG
jgi:predicted molibdopterin-dependent oxidoreductase YjgC